MTREEHFKTIVERFYDFPASALPIRLVFDVDGVICDNSDIKVPYADRKPFLFAIDQINKLKSVVNYAGLPVFHISLCTARYMSKEDGDAEKAKERGLQELVDWAARWNLAVDDIILGKPSAYIYIDDRGFKLDSNKDGLPGWIKLMQEIGDLEVYPLEIK